jgi:hypothetical protein
LVLFFRGVARSRRRLRVGILIDLLQSALAVLRFFPFSNSLHDETLAPLECLRILEFVQVNQVLPKQILIVI